MGESRGLPFGRPPTQVPRSQFIDERRRSLPRSDGWILSGLNSDIYTEVSDGALTTANQLILHRLHLLDADYLITKAVAHVTGASASTSAQAGLYQLLRETGAFSFRLIAGSAVTFDASSTGRKTVTLPLNGVQLREGDRLFMGSLVSSVVPTFTIAQGHSTNIEQVRTLSTATLPAKIPLNATTASTSEVSTLLVAYYSAEASLVV